MDFSIFSTKVCEKNIEMILKKSDISGHHVTENRA